MKNLYVILVLLLLTTSLFGDEHKQLTLEQCFHIALDLNPLNRASIEGVLVASEAVGVAQAPYYPEVGINSHYRRFRQFFFLPTGGPLGSLGITPVIGPENDWGLDVSGHYLLYDYGKRRAQLDAALAEQGIARDESARIRQQILLNVALAYHSLVASKKLFAVTEDILARAKEHYGIAKSRNDVGDSPAIDMYRSQVQVAQAEQSVVRARSNVRIASGNLNTAMGLPPQLEIDVASEVGEVIPPNTLNICDALEQSTISRPEVKQALGRITSGRSKVDEAKSAFGPRIHVDGLYGKMQNVFFPYETEWAVAVELELSIFRGFEDVHNVRKARYNLSKEKAEYDQVLLNVRQDVWNAHSSLQEAYELIQSTEAQVKDASESLRLSGERYKVGSSTINDLLDSQTALAQSEADHVGALWQYKSAEAQYQWAQGRMFVGCVNE